MYKKQNNKLEKISDDNQRYFVMKKSKRVKKAILGKLSNIEINILKNLKP